MRLIVIFRANVNHALDYDRWRALMYIIWSRVIFRESAIFRRLVVVVV